MHWAKFINMREHHFNALRLGLEALETQQGIEPDQSAAGTMEPIHLELQP
jgi:hypothetical protein